MAVDRKEASIAGAVFLRLLYVVGDVVVMVVFAPRVRALSVPQRQIVVGHDGRGVLGIQKRRLRVLVPGVAILGGGELVGRAALFALELGGAGHGAAVDGEADENADDAADDHAEVVDGLVAGGHGVALLGEDGEAAADEDVDEQLGAVSVVSSVKGKTSGGEQTNLDSAVETAKDIGVMLGIVAKKPLLRLNGSGQNRMPVKYRIPS